jgi:formylglycine-generating enzyme required for sulfatase activity
MLGLFPKFAVPGNIVNQTGTPTPSPAESVPPTKVSKADMADIPGGSFMMGRNGGKDNERPEHPVTVKDFAMDKTEVTNAEFLEFMNESGYKPTSPDKFLAHWENNRPVNGQELAPVRYVNFEDIKAFIAWRSKRDSVAYRLPTEQEWEYAARNGDKKNLFPWGNKFDPKCAVLDRPRNDPEIVGSKSCANVWGVQDLIGNVFEWTGSEPALYPGSPGEVVPMTEPRLMLRGGAAIYKSSGPNAITSTFRVDLPANVRSAEIGFRLVRGG